MRVHAFPRLYDLPQALKNGVFISTVDNLSAHRSLNSRVATESHDRESGLSSPACGWEDNHTERSLALLKSNVHSGMTGRMEASVDEHSG